MLTLSKTPTLVACVLAVTGTAAAAATRIPISRTGRINGLRMNSSTAAQVERMWGQPTHTYDGWLGYHCRPNGNSIFSSCLAAFWISPTTHRLESFATTSSRFVLYNDLHVGTSWSAASLRQRGVPDCDEFLSTAAIQITLLDGGTEGENYVRWIGIDANHGSDDIGSQGDAVFCGL
jgi:hypothetical protein